MSAFASDRPRRKFPFIVFLLVLIVAGLLGAAWYFKPRFESQPPQVKLTPEPTVLGQASTVEILVTDAGTGLKSVTATLSAGGTDHTLASEQYAEPVREKKIALDLSKLKGLKEGAAVLRVIAR